MLRLLCGLDDCRFVEVALVVDIELAESILQAEDLALLELGILPVCNIMLATVEAGGGTGSEAAGDVLLQLDNVHVGNVQMNKSAGEGWVRKKGYTRRQIDCLAQPRCAFDLFDE